MTVQRCDIVWILWCVGSVTCYCGPLLAVVLLQIVVVCVKFVNLFKCVKVDLYRSAPSQDEATSFHSTRDGRP